MKLTFKLIVAALSLTLLAKSQNTVVPKRGCGTKVPPPEWDAWFNQKVKEYKDNKSAAKTQDHASVTIPVIVHIIHGGQTVGLFPNITQAQVRSQIDVLNKDYAGIGYNSYQLAATGFSAVGIANTNITFCLAQYDPSGNLLPEPGIDRVNYTANGWPNPNTPTTSAAFQSLMDNTIKPNTIWDATNYFNIWVSDVNFNAELLGYATFPAGSTLVGLPSTGNAGTDGIWVWARSFGTTGAAQAPYNLGRTASHEAGHWLGLRHVGGDGNGNVSGDCSATDYCNDTPPQTGGNAGGQYGQNFGSPTYPLHANSCPPNDPYGDMFMNFMDYVDDAYCYMFTPDQNDRIQTALVNGYFRNMLPTSATTLCAGMPYADFTTDSIACFNGGVAPYNITDGGLVTPTYSWSVKPSTAVTFSPNSQNANPTINFPGVGFYTITMVATNSLGVSAATMTIRLENCTGLSGTSLFNKTIHLFPNPSSGQLNISTNLSAEKGLDLSIYNALGELVLANRYQNSSNFNIDLSAFPNGVYSVSISNGDEKLLKRLILNK